MPRRSTRVRRRALRALAYPARLELVEALMEEQPATVEDIAQRLGRRPRALYHHLRPLLEAGLVVEAGSRPTGKRPAALYALPAERLELDPDDRTPTARTARLAIARSLLRTALARHARALADPALELGGRRRELTLAHRVARLTPVGLARVNARLTDLMDALVEEHDPRGRPFALTVQLAPTGPRADD